MNILTNLFFISITIVGFLVSSNVVNVNLLNKLATKNNTNEQVKENIDSEPLVFTRLNDLEEVIVPDEVAIPAEEPIAPVTQTPPPVVTPKTPENNGSPKIEYIKAEITPSMDRQYNSTFIREMVPNKDYYSNSSIYTFTAKASDHNGIEKVEFYLNNDLKKTVYTTNLSTKGIDYWGEGDRGKAEEDAIDYILGKESDLDQTYQMYTYYKKAEEIKSGYNNCNNRKGMHFIFLGGDKFYAGVSSSEDNFQLCYKGDTIYYKGIYGYRKNSLDKGDYKFYVKAYDTLGAVTKSDSFSFEVN